MMSFSKFLIPGSLVFFLFSACKSGPAELPYSVHQIAVEDSCMVVTAHPLATEVGVQILKQGGNAIDAMVAVQFALAVVYPRAGNLGGGGFLVYRDRTGMADALDFREKAPLGATRDMYLDSLQNPIPDLSTKGVKAAGVPGTVAGLITAYEKYGSLLWDSIVAPAILLAEKGFPIQQSEADRLNQYQEDFLKYSAQKPVFYRKNGWKQGDILIQKDLANTLKRIASKRFHGFYTGETAAAIVKEMEAGQGLITAEDLENYRPVWRKPIAATYKNYRIISMPPSSSGGTTLVQMLKMTEGFPVAHWGLNDFRTRHLMVEVMRRAYADRAVFLGDMDFYRVPLDSLLDSIYLQKKISDFKLDQISPSSNFLGDTFQLKKERFETTHTSIIDSEGNAASLTTTINGNYGCKVWVGGAGFFLNNEMDDFSAKPGYPNQFGLVGAEANAIEPGKRMLSAMTPTIVEKEGRLFMVLGTPGGATIITAVYQVFLYVTEFGMSLENAIRQPRFHHQWLPDEIMFEEGALNDSMQLKLASLGHQFRKIDRIAKMKAIIKTDSGWKGVGDPRIEEDDARGF